MLELNFNWVGKNIT